jgi:tetratricopeptide (TPR) repeat protein
VTLPKPLFSPGKKMNCTQSLLVSSRGMTPAYCSPEQAVGQKLSRKTDIWSWGLSLLEMFTGEVTWGIGMAAQEVLAIYKGQYPGIPVMPASVMNLLIQCFELQPERRPSTMLEVATELQAIYAHSVGRPYSREAPKPAEIRADILIHRGNSLSELGQPEGALLAYEQAIRLDPNSATAYLNKGNALSDLGQPEGALLAYEQAIRLDPNSATAYLNKGAILAGLGRPQEALLDWEQAIRLDPNSATAYNNQGVMLRRLGRLQEALLAHEQALRLNPNSAKAYADKDLVLRDLGRLQEAEQANRKWRELSH